MTPLPTQFKRKQRGFTWTYQQVARKGLIAIYHRTSGGKNEDWEVIRIKESQAGSMTVEEDGEKKTVRFTAKESYPGDNEWGTNGWTYITEADARNKLEVLLNQVPAAKKVPLRSAEGEDSGE